MRPSPRAAGKRRSPLHGVSTFIIGHCWMCSFPQSSSEAVGGAGLGDGASLSDSTGQREGPCGAGAVNTRISSCQFPRRPSSVVSSTCRPQGEGPCALPGPGPSRWLCHGILRAPVLLLHLRLRVHQQRATDGSHEGARGRPHQHHPEQGAAADGPHLTQVVHDGSSPRGHASRAVQCLLAGGWGQTAARLYELPEHLTHTVDRRSPRGGRTLQNHTNPHEKSHPFWDTHRKSTWQLSNHATGVFHVFKLQSS